MGDVIFETKGLSKAFFGKKVVSNVDFQLREGEICALLGENGAGKSTFKNMIVGLLEPTEGTIIFDGKAVGDTKKEDFPIAAVHQELSLFLNLSVAENICIEDMPGKHTVVDWKKCREKALKYMRIMNINLDPDAIVGTLGPGEQQLVEIAKALSHEPRVLILDEPTASLTAPERNHLFEVMNTLKKQNIGMIFITHFLDEVFQVCDRVVVLRNSEKVCDDDVKNMNKRQVEELMIGRSVNEGIFDLGSIQNETALKVIGLESEYFTNIHIEVKKGEILGIAGLIGAGRTELLESIFGIRKCTGEIEVLGQRYTHWTTQKLIRQGVVMIPEDRKNCGIFPKRDLKENITAAQMEEFVDRKVPCFGFKNERKNAEKVIAQYRVKCPGVDAYIHELSGGNQQKVIVGRWLSHEPKICMFDDPTRGVDVGSRAEIGGFIVDLAKKGAAVLLVSSDLNELVQLSHRIVIMRRGRLVGEVQKDEFDVRKILSISSSQGNEGEEEAVS